MERSQRGSLSYCQVALNSYAIGVFHCFKDHLMMVCMLPSVSLVYVRSMDDNHGKLSDLLIYDGIQMPGRISF